MLRSYLLLIIVLSSSILISACTPFETSTPPPSPQPVQVAYTPTLRPLIERLHQCALQHPEVALITHETSITALGDIRADVILWFGEPLEGTSSYAFSLGGDEIAIIAGANVSLQDLSAEKLRDLYADSDSAYQMWTYSQRHELRKLFDQAVYGESSIASYAKLAPDPAAMIEAIAADPIAVGYIPGSWLAKDIQTISVEDGLQAAFVQPVLALTLTEPVGNLHTYLVCLQSSNR